MSVRADFQHIDLIFVNCKEQDVCDHVYIIVADCVREKVVLWLVCGVPQKVWENESVIVTISKHLHIFRFTHLLVWFFFVAAQHFTMVYLFSLKHYKVSLYFIPAVREKTACELHRETALAAASSEGFVFWPRPSVGQYIPTCDHNRNYEPMQCHPSTGQCWCVYPDGQEVAGTRTGPGSRPSCTHRLWKKSHIFTPKLYPGSFLAMWYFAHISLTLITH